MRDILLVMIVGGLVPAILARPYIGAYAWAWLSLMNPHRGAWGFAATLPFAQVIAITTLVTALFTRKRHPFPMNPIMAVYLTFLIWMSFTSLFAINTPEIVLERWVFVAKIQVMILVTLLLLRGRQQIEILIWTITLSIGFYGVKGGVFTIATGGSHRVWGPPSSMVEGNNELAVALITLIPFMIYLYVTSSRKPVRWLMLFSVVTSGAAILGSYSRGALLALAAMALVLGLKGKRPVLSTAVLACALAGGVAVMPDAWTSRMETIGTYQQDTSAMSRIYTWRTLWALALDRPITGAGFATDSDEVFNRYGPPGENPMPGSTPVAHSIYLQALGEHGFPGLALYLLLGIMTWRTAGRLASDTRDDKEFGSWVPLLMKSVQISLIGFAAGGAFLTLVHFDLPYYFVAIVVLVDATIREKSRTKTATALPVTQTPMKGAR
jgi:probable O-glycosylation ligase (exosortase A-associated)